MLPPIEELTEELKTVIEWAIEHGEDNYLLNENNYPYMWGYKLNVVEPQTGAVINANSVAQLHASLRGEEPEALPAYNIDWDLRSSVTGNICTFEGELIMGTLDFDTAEQGAEVWAKQIISRAPSWSWVTDEEAKMIGDEIEHTFEQFFHMHCDEAGDCPIKTQCKVRWPGGFGLGGCRIGEVAEGGHMMTDKGWIRDEQRTVAKAIHQEIVGFRK